MLDDPTRDPMEGTVKVPRDLAFPSQASGEYAEEPGMDMSDYFAARIAASLVVSGKYTPEEIAELSYRTADALCKKRRELHEARGIY